MLREEIEEAVRSLKAGKYPGADNLPSELLKNRAEATTIHVSDTPENVGDGGMAE